jgi:hypothetical protein
MGIFVSILYWLGGLFLLSILMVSVYRLLTEIRELSRELSREPIRVTATMHTREIPFETVIVPIHSITNVTTQETSDTITVSSNESFSIKLNKY